MVMRKIYLLFITYLFLISFLFIQCKNTQEYEVREINVSTKENNKINLSTLFKSVEALEFEEIDELYYIKPTKLIVKNDMYYFLSGDMIIVYNSDAYEFTLFNKGEGPGEYINISDFFVDDDENIVINDREGRKLIYYDKQGKHIKDIKHGLLSYNFIKLDHLVYMNSGNLLNGDIKCKVNTVDERTGEIVDNYLKQNEKTGYLSIIEYTNFSFFSDTLSYSQSFSNVIYHLKDGVAIPRLKIDFRGNNLPESFSENYTNLMEFVDDFKKSNYASRIDNYRESDSYLSFIYSYTDEYFNVFFDKRNNKVYNFKSYYDDFLFPDIEQKKSYDLLSIFADENSFYFSIEASYFMDMCKKSNNISPVAEKIYSNITEDSNAIILKYNLNK
jgi:hypothetical protein